MQHVENNNCYEMLNPNIRYISTNKQYLFLPICPFCGGFISDILVGPATVSAYV